MFPFWPITPLLVSVFPMPNGDYINQSIAVKDLVYDPVISDPDSPEIPRPPQLATARWPRVPRQGLDPREEPG